MALIDQVRAACSALSKGGFRELLLHVTGGELDIAASDLAGELSKPLTAIDRTTAGFEDFAQEGERAIEPRCPARSLLYHSLASPCVSRLPDGHALRGYPSLVQIEAVENYVYGAAPPSIDDLAAERQEGGIAIAVFALEYRPGARTPHRRHADLCLSRTGIARVGTAPASYDAATRQFEPLDDADPHAFRVLPARYAPFLAVQRPGRADELPDRFMPGDGDRQFWVPIHKLFEGSECIEGLDLNVILSARHRNEKLGRFHAALWARGYETGWGGSDLDNPPFRFRDGIAEFSDRPELGRGLLVPDVHERLVEPAVYNGKPLCLSVPKDLKAAHSASTVLDRYFSGLEILPEGPYAVPSGQAVATGRSHAAPELINARHQVLPDGSEVNLNDRPDVWDIVAAGGYEARHFVDFTGDGWISVTCPELDLLVPLRLSAYSIVSGPDFFPYCDQLQLMEWWPRLPAVIREGLWAVIPRALSDARYAPNATLTGSGFDAPDGSGLRDTTATAVLCPPRAADAFARPCPEPAVELRSALPDSASGVFDPGWDVSTDTLPLDPEPAKPATGPDKEVFFSGYGLGTPFVEDAKICAALGTYWPAVSPDATRTFQPDKYWPTISPLTDEEIGIVGEMPWDGIKGPVRIADLPDQPAFVEYTDIDYADYVDQALAKRLTAALTSRIDFAEYTRRVLAMAWIYWALGLRLPSPIEKDGKKRSFNRRLQILLLEKAEWNVLSFLAIPPGQPDARLQQVIEETRTPLAGEQTYRCELFRHGKDSPSPTSFKLRHVEIVEEVHFYTDLIHVFMSRGGGPWQARAIPTS